MAEKLSLVSSLFAEVTPAGAYYAISNPRMDNARRMLIRIIRDGHRAPLTPDQLINWAEADSLDQALQLLFRLQRLEFIQGVTTPRVLPPGNLETILPPLLEKLSNSGRALLADDNGFYLATVGFHHETAEEIGALAGDLLTFNERHSLLLRNHLNLNSSAWAISDPTGRSELGFFPLYIGSQSFVLIIGGLPQFQTEYFLTLTEALIRRYS